MAYVQTTGMEFPTINEGGIVNLGTSSTTIDAAGEAVIVVLSANEAKTLDTISFRFGSITSAADIKVSIQGVDATTGNPDGVISHYRVFPTVSGDANSFVTTGLITTDGTDGGAKKTFTLGEKFAVVFEFNSAVGNLQIWDAGLIGNRAGYNGNNYLIQYLSSVYTKQAARSPMILFNYSDGTVSNHPSVWPPFVPSSANLNSGSATFDEAGITFTPNFSFKATGVSGLFSLAGDADMVVYDSDGTTALETLSLDKDIKIGTGSYMFFQPFSQERTFTKNLTYRITLKPTSGTNVTLFYFDVSTNNHLNAISGGSSVTWTQRVDAGAWTQNNVRRPFFSLQVSQIDDGTGSGGGGGGGGSFVF
jgi:hypothetical protein